VSVHCVGLRTTFNVCLSGFYTTQILMSTTVLLECISWLIKVSNNNDARWKHEINLPIHLS
jgi:hypothetical protein